MAIYVGRWDCPSCGNRMIEGPLTRCPNCGSSRPEDVQFYLPSEAEIVREEARKREAMAGVDWICGHCRSQNKANDTSCSSCGNPRDHLSQDVDLQEKSYNQGAVARSAQQRSKLPQPSRKRSKAGRNLLLLFSMLIGLWILLAWPKNIAVEVVGFEWHREVQMEHYEAVADEAWELPTGAFNVRQKRAVHHYDQVFSHTETYYENVRVRVGEERYICGKIDLGNGYFKDRYCSRPIYDTRREKRTRPVYDQVPVYATKYYFNIMRWVPRRDQLLQQTGYDQEAIWPSQSYQDAEAWRVGARQGRYYIIVRTPSGSDHKEEITENRWIQLELHQGLPASQSLIFGTYQGLKE